MNINNVASVNTHYSTNKTNFIKTDQLNQKKDVNMDKVDISTYAKDIISREFQGEEVFTDIEMLILGYDDSLEFADAIIAKAMTKRNFFIVLSFFCYFTKPNFMIPYV